ncbi:MAG: hypothetical protein U0167_13250 [bacterium]
MHPKDEELIALLFGEAPKNSESAQHVASCARCRGALRQLEELVRTLREDRDPEPPQDRVAAAIALRRPAAVAGIAQRLAEFARGLVEEAVALVTDSSATLAPAGVRSAAASRRLRFESGDVELDLAIERAGTSQVLTGQLLRLRPRSAPAAGSPLLVLDARDRPHEVTTDDLGEFVLEVGDASRLVIRAVVDDHLFVFDVAAEPASER